MALVAVVPVVAIVAMVFLVAVVAVIAVVATVCQGATRRGGGPGSFAAKARWRAESCVDVHDW